MRVVPPLGFLGAGKMATALARGWLAAGLTKPDRIIASDPVPAAREAFQRDVGGNVVTDNRQVIQGSEVVFLAVKPQMLTPVLKEIQPILGPKHLVVSFVAGVTLAQLTVGLGPSIRIIRVMPNTPSLVGACAAAISPGTAATSEDAQLVEKMFKAIGVAFRLPEKLLDAVTGLSGSGPAYIAVIIEALSDGGVRMGLPRDVSTALAAQTVMGSAKMVLDADLHPGLLKDMVASPGGTTIAGLHALERGGLRAALMDAVEAATRRAEELGKEAGKMA
ncbi:MAG TPA: pyrroline-5-carboxylate reductase [Gemmataceae bacterium]|nr:pyrroline-5-carboxylate reductase [Gemmataceae bacterium]